MSLKNNEILEQMCNINGIAGYENDIIEFLYSMLNEKAHLDDVFIDNVGNLICYKRGTKSSKTVMISAHIDEVGFQIINEIKPGEYKLKTLGNIKTWNAIQQRVCSNTFRGIIYSKNYENIKHYNYDNLFLRVMFGKPNIGDVCTFQSNFMFEDGHYYSKALDNRISCYCLYNLIDCNIKSENDIYYVFTVQEEFNMRGIRVAKSAILPDIHIDIDVSAECDMNSVCIGKGVAIKISDAMSVSTPYLVKNAIEIAEENSIKFQLEVSDCGASELIISNLKDNGCEELGISIPCQNIHCANSIVSKEDVDNCEKLIAVLIESLK